MQITELYIIRIEYSTVSRYMKFSVENRDVLMLPSKVNGVIAKRLRGDELGP